MSFTKVNLKKAGNGAGVPQDKDTQIVIFEVDDLRSEIKRDAKGVKVAQALDFKSGKYAILIYATSSSISLPRTSEGDEDQIARTNLPEFAHPGSTLEFEEFCENMINVGLGVAVRLYDEDNEEYYYKIFGSKAAPVYLMDEGQDNNEATKNMVRFQQFKPTKHVPARYYGTFPFAESNLVPADTAVIDVTDGEGEYQLQDNAAATEITGLSNAEHGGKYTLMGSGGNNPATIDSESGNFVLSDGTDWEGLEGAKITLKAYAQGGGSFIFIEQSRE